MNLAVAILLTASAAIFASRWRAFTFDRHADEALSLANEGPSIPASRRPSDLSSGVGWARESTPIHDRLVCESIERQEGWS